MTEENVKQIDFTLEDVRAAVADCERRVAAAQAALDAWERLQAVVKPYMLKDPNLRMREALVLAEVDRLKAQGLTLSIQDRADIAARHFTVDGVLDEEGAARALNETVAPWEGTLAIVDFSGEWNIKLLEDEDDQEAR